MYLESTARLAFLTLSCAIKSILKPECYLSSVICLPKVKDVYGSFFCIISVLHCVFFSWFSLIIRFEIWVVAIVLFISLVVFFSLLES